MQSARSTCEWDSECESGGDETVLSRVATQLGEFVEIVVHA